MMSLKSLSKTLVVSAFMAGAGVSLAPMSASATLIGDTVTIGHYFPDVNTPCICNPGPQNTVVHAGSADAITTGINDATYTVDVGANGFSVVYLQRQGWDITTDFNGLIVSDLNWVGMSGSIIGVSVDAAPAGFDMNDITFTADSVSINFGGTLSQIFEDSRWDISLITSHEVPEPGTLALFGLGLAGLGFARRRKAA